MAARDLVADIRLAQAGDERAAARLAAHARRTARPVLQQHFRCTEDIEDCLQDVLLRVMRHLRQLREVERFESWVASIARRAAWARQRDNRTLPLPIGAVEPATPAPSSGPGRLATEVQAAQRRLSAARRQLLDLRYRDDLGYAEIAQRLGTTVPRVRRRLQGARNQLRREVLRHMATEQGEGVCLTREDLDRLYGAATLVDPEAEGSMGGLHISERTVMGGSTHRLAGGTLSCQAADAGLVLDAEPLLELRDHPDVREAALGWTEEAATLALDDGTRLVARRLERELLTERHRQGVFGELPRSVSVSHAELLELAETLAAVPWRRNEHDEHALAGLATLPGGGLSLQAFGMGVVSYMMSGMLGSSDPGEPVLQMLLNRRYVRDCVRALPRRCESVRVEFAGPHQQLRFVSPELPDFAVAMMPIHRDALTPDERRTWAELLSAQADAVRTADAPEG